jgi:hypothetical protein
MLNSKRLKIHVVYTEQEDPKWPEVVWSGGIRVRTAMELKEHIAELDICIKRFILLRWCNQTSEKGREVLQQTSFQNTSI